MTFIKIYKVSLAQPTSISINISNKTLHLKHKFSENRLRVSYKIPVLNLN